MSYLERNRELIAEINDEVRHGLQLGGAESSRSQSGTVFKSSGKIDSKVLGKELYLGLKENKRTELVRTFMELAFIKLLVESAPELAEELPVVYGAVETSESNGRIILVEDFSQGGVNHVYEVPHYEDPKYLPFQIRTIKTDIPDSEIATSCFYVDSPDGDSRRRIGDLDKLMPWGQERFNEAWMEIYDYQESYTVYGANISV